MSKQKLHSALSQCIDTSIEEIISQYSSKDMCIIIGACYPKDNLLLDFKDASYFPKKLTSIIDRNPSLKWILREQDIDIDIQLFNEVLLSIFNERFNRLGKQQIDTHRPQVVYVTHRKLDCYMVFKTIKWAYGNTNCVNIWKEKLSQRRQNLVAINDLISKYVHAKNRINKSKEFKQYALEVKQYLDKVLCLQEM